MFHRPNIFRKRNDLFVYNNSFGSIKNQNENQAAPKKDSKLCVSNVVSELFAKTSIHGLSYLGDHKRSIFERVWWAIAIALSFTLCGSWALKAWQLDGYDRIILRYDNEPMTIEEIPFPAVSICPVAEISVKKFNFTDVYRSLMKFDGADSRNVTPKEMETMKIVNQLCGNFGIRDNISKLFNDMYADDTIYHVLGNIGPDFNETFIYCKLLNEWIDCDKILAPFMSEIGLCYSFNTLSLREILTNEIFFDVSNIPFDIPQSTWNVDRGYDSSPRNQQPYPYRMIDVGLQYSLTIILKVDKRDFDYSCGAEMQGFRIGFHSPSDTPREIKKFFALSPNQASLYVIEPKMMLTHNDARKFRPHERQCFLNNEHKLRFFKHYTEANCALECLSNYTLAQCGCVHFSMLHANGAAVCGNTRLPCFMAAENGFYRSEDYKKCDCLPSCTGLSYDAYVSTNDFNFVRTLRESRHNREFDLENSTFSRIVVSFKDEDFNTFTRVEKYTWIDILSSVGGFCGLLVGASLLSVIELLYYFTLRIFFALRKRHESDGDAADNNHNDRDRVIYVSPATLRHLSNRSRTLDQTQPFTFVQRIR